MWHFTECRYQETLRVKLPAIPRPLYKIIIPQANLISAQVPIKPPADCSFVTSEIMAKGPSYGYTIQPGQGTRASITFTVDPIPKRGNPRAIMTWINVAREAHVVQPECMPKHGYRSGYTTAGARNSLNRLSGQYHHQRKTNDSTPHFDCHRGLCLPYRAVRCFSPPIPPNSDPSSLRRSNQQNVT